MNATEILQGVTTAVVFVGTLSLVAAFGPEVATVYTGFVIGSIALNGAAAVATLASHGVGRAVDYFSSEETSNPA